MNRRYKLKIPALSVLALISTCSAGLLQGEVVAFPGAEGYGRFSTGGRGGDVYTVTNLNDSGPGSLRDAIVSKEADVPRTIVFAVCGTIVLKSELQVRNVHKLTIAGQTAPGQGVTVRDYGINFESCSDIIVQYMRFRLGDQSKTSDDVIAVGPPEGKSHDIIFDHVTATWGIDGIMDVYSADKFTLQWCLFGEALHRSTHTKGPHAMLMSFRMMKGNVSIHHNLFFSSRDRHPSLGGYPPPRSSVDSVFDFRNNVIYNWEGPCNLATGRFHLVANYWKPGPNTQSYEDKLPIAPKARAQGVTTGIIELNHFDGSQSLTADNYSAFRWGRGKGEYQGVVTEDNFRLSESLVAPADRPMTHQAQEAYRIVLEQAGASRVRDDSDKRIVSGIEKGTNRRIDSQEEVGGWPRLESEMTAAMDSDGDGMSDVWERVNKLDVDDPEDRNRVNSYGYTNLELYLHSLATPSN